MPDFFGFSFGAVLVSFPAGDTTGDDRERGFFLQPVLTPRDLFSFPDGPTGVWMRDIGLSPVLACGSASILRLRRGRSSEPELSADLRRLVLVLGRLLSPLGLGFMSWS